MKAEKTKSNSTVTVTWDDDVMTLNVVDAGTIVVPMERLAPEIKARSACHGIEQRLRDRAAISRNPDTGKPATPQEKFDRVKTLADYYLSGATVWEMPRGDGAPKVSPVLMAYAEYAGLTIDDARDRIDTLAASRSATAKQILATLATQKDIAEIIARNAGAGDDADDLLGELM